MSAMAEERIRERAHAIWIDEGCPEGRDQEHWLRAEQEVAASAAAPAKAPVKRGTARKPSVRKDPVAAPEAAARKPRARKAAATA